MKSTPIAPSGCETSSERGLSHQAKSINATLGKSMLATLTASHNAISSQGSEDGVTPYDSRCTQTIDLFGQDHAPANPSPQPEKAKHLAMNATSGPLGSGLSELADQAEFMGNKLKRLLNGVGSTLFTLIWKRKATPLGRPYYQLAASGRRTSDKGFGSHAQDNLGAHHHLSCGSGDHLDDRTSWPSPNAGPQNDGDTTWQQRRVKLKEKHGNGNGFGMVLGQAAQLASWPTPTLHDAERGGQEKRAMGETRHGSNLQDFTLTAGWGTPTSRDHKHETEPRFREGQGQPLNREVLMSGPISSGSPAQTESKGQLNPAFSLWLMGYPAEWLSCAPQATRSSRKSRQSSSKRAWDE
jgi:hypothetical protein